MDLHSYTEGQDEKTVLYSNVTKPQKHLKSLDSSVIPCRSRGPERGIRRAWDGFIIVDTLEKCTWEMLKSSLKLMGL